VHSDVDRLPGAQKACAEGQLLRHVGELRAEDTRLYSPRAVSAPGRDGSLLSTCAAFAADSAWQAKTNKRNTSAGTSVSFPWYTTHRKANLQFGQVCMPRTL
jgi:hypothetical protein